MKIAIVGNPGSGKSTLATRLHSITGIPVYHLDQYYWKPGWQRPIKEEFAQIHQELCDKERWIIEGVAMSLFDYRAEKADIIIFFDVPTYLCLFHVFKRAITSFRREYFSSAKGCPEKLPDVNLLRYIWNYNRDKKPEIEALLEKYKNQKQIFVVKNNTELNELIKKFESKSI